MSIINKTLLSAGLFSIALTVSAATAGTATTVSTGPSTNKSTGTAAVPSHAPATASALTAAGKSGPATADVRPGTAAKAGTASTAATDCTVGYCEKAK